MAKRSQMINLFTAVPTVQAKIQKMKMRGKGKIHVKRWDVNKYGCKK